MGISSNSAYTIPFPETPPKSYEWLPDELLFDSSQRLALERPTEVVTFDHFCYTDKETKPTATVFTISTLFHILSGEGAELISYTARELRAFATRAGNRIENCYAQWLLSSR